MTIRATLLGLLDRLYLRLASRKYGLFGPITTYQPLPWLGLTGGRRARGCVRRLDAIRRQLDKAGIRPRTVLDVGANVGFFSLSFAEAGADAYAVEGEERNLRLGLMASKRLIPGSGSFVAIARWCDRENISALPSCDVTLCLSVWHHWVRHFGIDAATDMLKSLLARTKGVLFFDSGEREMPVSYGLPFGAEEPESWLQRYLGSLGPVQVSCLGRFEAFEPGSTERAQAVSRQLFAVDCRRQDRP